MKILLLLVFLSFTAINTFAQINAEKLLYLEKSEKYRKMRNAGTILSIGGTVLVVAGMATILNAAEETNTYYGTASTVDEDKLAKGVIMYVAGIASTGAGVPLWIVGGINHARYNRKFQQLSANVIFSPRTSGLRLTYRF